VVRKIWADENFSHKGKYYTCEKNTPLSPPLVQKPHPPLYVSAQSAESIHWAASQDIPFGQIDALVEESEKDQKVYREIQMAHGFAPVPRLFVTRDVYVAATDEQARREAKPYLIRNWDLWNRYTQFSVSGQMPDSYDLWRKRAPMLYALSYEEIIDHGLILVGTPDTVVRIILEQQSTLAIAMMVLGFRFGGMPYDLAQRSMHLFATEVMPELRRREAVAPAPSHAEAAVSSL
jgi:alkanesulfonate monooxygenase SsuD/methylene tetrahydromethanopterin reductase-like flavin-dependent oxidoreductase (luciferase family)